VIAALSCARYALPLEAPHLKMASVVTTDFVRTIHADSPPFSLIEQQGLFSRLIQAIEAAVTDLVADPRGFIRDLFSADTKDSKRRQRIYLGLSCAIVTHIALIALIAVIGVRTIFVKHPDVTRDSELILTHLATRAPDNPTKDGSVPKGDKEAGSGGGGDRNPLPPTRGPLPQMSSDPQIVKPNTPQAVLPTLQVSPTIVGPDGSTPPPGVALGIPIGAIASAPSPGPGVGEGLGGKRGSGAGPGSGPSTGPGENGSGPGGKGRIGLPTGVDEVKGPIPYNLITNFPDRTPIVWLYRPTPVTTPEAQANKVKGEVWLRATFGEDGKISDIEVIREVQYMTESAMEALQKSRFRPATVKGRPVTLTNVPVRINVDVFKR
jgi:TonB-like protein